MLASKPNGTLYIGVTGNLAARVYEHKEGRASTFTRRYGVSRLVWYEAHERIEDAIQRETSLKRWNRAWKIDLIRSFNPDWKDLYETLNA